MTADIQPITVDRLLDDLVLADLDAICDRTGLTMADLAALASMHAAPADLGPLTDEEAHEGHPEVTPELLARAELHALGGRREVEALPRRVPGVGLAQIMAEHPDPTPIHMVDMEPEDGCE